MSVPLSRLEATLPLERTSLIGRERESARLLELLDDRTTRLVSITGPGGVGKTRLALHVAAAVLDAGREVGFIPLAPVTDPAVVAPAILRGLGAPEQGAIEAEDQLVNLLGSRDLLLVLDNLEQVRDVAPVLASILERCPHIAMLCTSQAPLVIAGERRFPVEPLATPGVAEASFEAIAATEAVGLFVERAHAANPSFALDARSAPVVAEICRRLDGLPLAIELAAARTRVLSPEALLDRLDNRFRLLGGGPQDAPDRLRTMRNAVAWTYDLLSPDEQRLFRSLSVFAGGISLEAIEAIHQPGSSGRPALDVLGELVDHSLVIAMPSTSAETRYSLLQTLRDYGLERLAAEGEEETARLAHAMWYIALAEAARPHLVGRGQAAWFERVQPELENLRVAADWLLATGREALVLRLIGPLWRFFSTTGPSKAAREWLRRALASPSARDAPARAIALVGAGNLFEDIRQLDTARAYFEEARAVAAASANSLVESEALIGLGIIAHDAGDYATALPFHERALELARASGNRHLVGRALGSLGAVSYYQGRLDDAERYWDEARSIMGEAGDLIAEATGTGNLGALAYERGDLERAEALQLRALELQRRLRSSRDLPYSLINLAGVATLRNNFELAHACIAEAIALLREAGNTAIEGIALNVAAGLALAEGNAVDCAALLLDSMRLVGDSGDQRAVVENAEMLAEACAATGRLDAGAVLLAAAVRGRRELGAKPTPFKQEELERIGASIRERLTPKAQAAAEADGNRLDLDALPRRMSTIARDIVGKRRGPVEIAVNAVPQPVDYGLTAREREVLRLLTEGLTTDELADQLFISPRTATTHLTRIMAKLGVASRTAAVAVGMRNGIV